ncbi:DNA polymerase III, epsilon subunit [Zymobacter palmae]|uniref:DNA-directed DNA polymerase n=1 Tax=Zymobacter palmae TaxID=33074 RepID=A0A348HEL9_9GAMM|nr:DNA polymerase III, epsilon subunit [Zymobacter palmae]
MLDTLKMARTMHPGQRNSLDALCKRYDIDNSSRTLHGALLDSEILAEVYLAMTGGQTALMLSSQDNDSSSSAASHASSRQRVALAPGQLRVIRPSETEWEAHQKKLDMIRGKSGGECAWDKLNG